MGKARGGVACPRGTQTSEPRALARADVRAPGEPCGSLRVWEQRWERRLLTGTWEDIVCTVCVEAAASGSYGSFL